MEKDNCKEIVEEAQRETNFVKKAVAFNNASRCYKKINDLEQYKLMKEKAIEIFHQEGEKITDYYEKALIFSYEALCLICLKQFEKVKALLKQIEEMKEKNSEFMPPLIVDFVSYLVNQEVDKAENLWKELYQGFSPGIINLMEEAFITINPDSTPPTIKKEIHISRTWLITFAGKSYEPKDDWNLTFYDATELFKSKLILKSEFIDDLIDTIKKEKHYHFVQNIRSVVSSSGEDFSNKAIEVILATSAEKKLKFGILLGHLKDGGLHVLAIWPEALAKAVGTDKDIFGAFITRLVESPEWFSDVNLITYISEEAETPTMKKDLPTKSTGLPGYYT